MEDPTQYLVEQIQNYFLPSIPNRNATSLIKVHNCKLNQIGDISFPLSSEIWENYFKIPIIDRENNIFGFESDTEKEALLQKLKEFSQNWKYPLAEVKLQKDRCALFLGRKHCIEMFINQVLTSNNYGLQLKDPKKRYRLSEFRVSDGTEGLSEYRARLVHRTLKKLLMYSNWSEANDKLSGSKVEVVSVVTKVPNADSQERVIAIRCGNVLDPQDGKLARIAPAEYISLRSTDMRLMAMHKYGIRVKDDQKFCELFRRLGEAAVTVDLLEVKPSSPVNMIRSGQGSTKGASFILYNSARLETLLRTFEEKITTGIYEKLPPLSNVDFSLLSNEEEWELLYGYIFGFTNLVNRCTENFVSGSCGVHYLIKYLDGLVSTFSVYYRRVRILTETRAHLMPHVYARIYLLKAVRQIFNMSLALLDIEPVEFM
ncbi:DALR anticodon-binding domain-containing protein 3 [Eupeodes corollae]|uniref:DALR anticodon-binding domain-containing protein 3 n=1 Tax=Eupeodes corollae TaxID=290404 RepID=UPI002491C44C|nr:DALR anticodon-binding domain-containing protein 3 [Eupeodes corollae]